MKHQRFRTLTLPLSALVLAGALTFTPVLVRGAGTTPTPTPTPPPPTTTQPVPPQDTPVGIQVTPGDHAVAVEHTLADGTPCLIVVHLIGGVAVTCATPGTSVGNPVVPVIPPGAILPGQ